MKILHRNLFLNTLLFTLLSFTFFALFAVSVFAQDISTNNKITDIFNNNTNDNFLVITDIHLNNNFSHTMSIEPLTYNPNNDLDVPTFKKLIATLKKNILDKKAPKPKFIVLLGDLVGHKSKDLEERHKDVVDDISIVLKTIKNTFPRTPLLYVFGNNDSFEKNYGLFEFKETKQLKNERKKHKKANKAIVETYSPYLIAKKVGWRNGFLSTGTMCYKQNGKHQSYPCLLTENKNDGYYVAKIGAKFRFIALNSILFSTKNNDEITQNKALNELVWLEQQLQNVKDKNESVLIAMHIPVGCNIFDHSVFWHKKYETKFIELINKYSANISGIIVGHTHLEEFKLFQKEDETSQINSIAISNSEISNSDLSTNADSNSPKNNTQNNTLTNNTTTNTANKINETNDEVNKSNKTNEVDQTNETNEPNAEITTNKDEDKTSKQYISHNIMLFTAGFSTSHGNSPGVKSIFYIQNKDTSHWNLYDYITFDFKSNIKKHEHEILSLHTLYSFRDMYCKNSLEEINSKYSNMLECLKNQDLSNIVNRMQLYYTNGNSKFAGIIFSPQDIYVR